MKKRKERKKQRDREIKQTKDKEDPNILKCGDHCFAT